jgi:hypothetical protein
MDPTMRQLGIWIPAILRASVVFVWRICVPLLVYATYFHVRNATGPRERARPLCL